MLSYNEAKIALVKFIKENNIDAYDVQRIAKRLCCCGKCNFFVQHYSKEGIPVDFGHCRRCNIPHSKKPSTPSCGFWEEDEEENEQK